MRELLNGIIDMHVHNGPSNAKRLFDTGEFCREADSAGYRAFITKDHYFPSMMTAAQANSLLEGRTQVKAYGSLILNNSVGGINLKAVDAACQLDCKYLSLPTISAGNHIDFYQGKSFPGSAALSVPEKPLAFLTEAGGLVPEIESLLQYLAQKEKAPVLATGHGSREEQDAVIRRAAELGVRILVNHPYYGFDARVEDIADWARLGAFIELTAVCFIHNDKFHDFLGKLIEQVPMEQFVLDSDMGQADLESPVEGVYQFIQLLMKKFGLSEKEINLIGKENPAKLMNL